MWGHGESVFGAVRHDIGNSALEGRGNVSGELAWQSAGTLWFNQAADGGFQA